MAPAVRAPLLLLLLLASGGYVSGRLTQVTEVGPLLPAGEVVGVNVAQDQPRPGSVVVHVRGSQDVLMVLLAKPGYSNAGEPPSYSENGKLTKCLITMPSQVSNVIWIGPVHGQPALGFIDTQHRVKSLVLSGYSQCLTDEGTAGVTVVAGTTSGFTIEDTAAGWVVPAVATALTYFPGDRFIYLNGAEGHVVESGRDALLLFEGFHGATDACQMRAKPYCAATTMISSEHIEMRHDCVSQKEQVESGSSLVFLGEWENENVKNLFGHANWIPTSSTQDPQTGSVDLVWLASKQAPGRVFQLRVVQANGVWYSAHPSIYPVPHYRPELGHWAVEVQRSGSTGTQGFLAMSSVLTAQHESQDDQFLVGVTTDGKLYYFLPADLPRRLDRAWAMGGSTAGAIALGAGAYGYYSSQKKKKKQRSAERHGAASASKGSRRSKGSRKGSSNGSKGSRVSKSSKASRKAVGAAASTGSRKSSGSRRAHAAADVV